MALINAILYLEIIFRPFNRDIFICIVSGNRHRANCRKQNKIVCVVWSWIYFPRNKIICENFIMFLTISTLLENIIVINISWKSIGIEQVQLVCSRENIHPKKWHGWKEIHIVEFCVYDLKKRNANLRYNKTRN